MLKKLTLSLALMMCALFTFGRQEVATSGPYDLVPYPQQVEFGTGSFTLTSLSELSLDLGSMDLDFEVKHLKNILANAGLEPSSVQGEKIELKYNAAINHPEAYQISVKPGLLRIEAGSEAGFFRGIQTFAQMLPLSLEKQERESIILPAVNIKDAPKNQWRGMHLDVSRHFFSVEYVKKFIDRLARYKFNKFHMHLTDDQGWRIEIKQYPKLTSVGAWRTFNNQDSVCMERAKTNPDFEIDPWHIKEVNGKKVYGGFYSQEEIKEIISYAGKQHIEVIPEIDMPGHMSAAIRAYPYLTGDQETGWGKVFSSPISPCQESTYEFAENVLDEIMELFPSKYVHIGADEVEKDFWDTKSCEEWMEENGISSLETLQSFFVNHMEAYVKSKGKELIVWDDALEGGISPTAHVMYWRSWVKDAPLKAAKNGNDVIMTPVGGLYFDYAPEKGSLRKVYNIDIVPNEFTAKQAEKIIGGQANIWTEYIPSEKRLDYMYMPRMTALAEKLWSDPADFDGYMERMPVHFLWMQKQGINYRLPDLEGIADKKVFVGKGELDVQVPLDFLTIRYTVDGTDPEMDDPAIDGKVKVTEDTNFRFAAFGPNGNRGDVYEMPFKKTGYFKAKSIKSSELEQGLEMAFHKGLFKETKLIKEHTADDHREVDVLDIPEDLAKGSFAAEFTGYIKVPSKGIYDFILTCDDGGKFYIDDFEVVDNDGLHPPREKTGQVALKAGLHEFRLDFIEGGGGYTLKLEYLDENGQRQPVPMSWLFYSK